MHIQPVRGMLDVETFRQMVADDRIETVVVAFPDMYGRLVGKRVTGHYFVDELLEHGMHGCDYLLTCDIEMDPVQGYAFSGWNTGYGDFKFILDIKTLRVASWLNKTAIILCDVYGEKDDAPSTDSGQALVSVAPRTVLRKQVECAANKGYIPMGASELEFYIFTDTYEEAQRKKYTDLKSIGYYIEDYHLLQSTKEEFFVGALRHHLDYSGVPVEFSKGEWGPGQHEVNVRYADFLETADRHTIYKHAAKEIAWQLKCGVTFMAKWDERYAGSSMHLHASLWDRNTGKALFPGDESYGPVHVSPIFRWFLGGWMAHVREMAAFYAPYPTSYKRYQADSFAPTRIVCSYDNRTVGFRIIGHGSSLRIECRMPGADANPYLAYAATLAAGLDGIENKIEPPAVFEGNAYVAQNLPQIPKTLNEAIHELDNSTWARDALGKDVIEHYLHFFRTEQRKFDEVVTTWERARYFERA